MKRAIITEVRPIDDRDSERTREFMADGGCTWLAIDSRGYQFGSTSEREARALAEQYHKPTHTSRERGRVSHPDRSA